MHKNLPIGKTLPNLEFIVLGFGDSSYQKYNEIAIKLYNRFNILGATPKLLSSNLESGLFLVDDSAPGGLMSGIHQFTIKLFSFLIKIFNLEIEFDWKSVESPSFIASFPSEILVKHGISKSKMSAYTNPQNITNYYSLECRENVRVTGKEHFQDTRLISFESTQNATYEAGDVVYIQAENSDEDVDRFFAVTQQPRDLTVRISGCAILDASIDHSLYSIVKACFNLNSTPNQFFFLDLASLHQRNQQSNPSERLCNELQRLLEFGFATTSEDVDEFYSYSSRMKRSLLEVLEDFPMTSLLLEPQFWFEVLPYPITPRAYSLCNAAHEPPQILVAVVNFKTKMKKPRKGICSSYLQSLSPGQRILCRIAKTSCSLNFSSHLLTQVPNRPCILIAPGTCVSPMRSFLLQQDHLACDMMQPNLLIFGCRTKSQDLYFGNEWNDLVKRNRLIVFYALSREPGVEKTYVQKVVTQQADLIWRYLSLFQASVMVVANTKSMARETRQAFLDIICKAEPSLDAEQFLQDRYQVEAWG
ncbi:NADPH-dependent diflavin oxidoreductase 1 [Cichlidogyrus casuarinus]|uniref:NADPH-dependent diflavin oxidoreductase 1 n=1 Tax=Cichlidogyrus casuarinus TaxID=1844966 RepID=A0ABD2Q4S1_9PLAT